MAEAAVKVLSAPVAIVDDARFDAHHDGSGHHPECPERLEAAREGLRAALGEPSMRSVSAREATLDELCRVHSPQYIERLLTRLGRGYGNLDPDTYFSPGTREAAWLAAGGVIDMAQ